MIHYHRLDMNGSSDDPFSKYWDKNDIFVLPRTATEDYEPLIKRLQIYNNQVLARHNRVTNFRFVKEDGVSDLLDMSSHYANSIKIFKETISSDRAAGNTGQSLNHLKTVFSYDLTQYGQADNLVEFLFHEYKVERALVRGKVFDRKFIYGEIRNPSTLKDVQGLENLYKKVVEPFRQGMITQAEKYVNFPYPWHPELIENFVTSEKLSTYIGDTSELSARDRDALNQYANNNGVPYYEGEGGKTTYADFEKKLKTLPDKWEGYEEDCKPNTKKAGVDCYGLVTNVLLEMRIGMEKVFDKTKDSYQRAFTIGEEQSRKITIDILPDDSTIIQSGDLIYSDGHIAICAIPHASSLSKANISDRYFTIIHNYGYFEKDTNKPGIYSETGFFTKGFFHKTLQGPFRHWGAYLISEKKNASVGRIYLWY